jgi:hypothetical protein
VCSEGQWMFEVTLALLIIISCEVCTVVCRKCILVIIWIDSELDFMSACLVWEKEGVVLVCNLWIWHMWVGY